MARIRTIKPEFQNSASMGRVSREARLTFILLWPQCDDAGRVRANSRMLASILFPYDDDAVGLIDGWLDELERDGCIVRYTVDEVPYLAIAAWSHQKIDHPSPSKLPGPPEKKQRKSKSKTRENDANAREQSDKPRAVSSTVSEGIEKTVGPDSFHKFFLAFPKKEQRDLAARAYAAALERGATDAELLAGAKRYAAHVAQEKIELKFVTLAKNWLRDNRWHDQYGATANDELVDETAARTAWQGLAGPYVEDIGAPLFQAWFSESRLEPGPRPRLVFERPFHRNWVADHSELLKPLQKHFPGIDLEVAA